MPIKELDRGCWSVSRWHSSDARIVDGRAWNSGESIRKAEHRRSLGLGRDKADIVRKPQRGGSRNRVAHIWSIENAPRPPNYQPANQRRIPGETQPRCEVSV